MPTEWLAIIGFINFRPLSHTTFLYHVFIFSVQETLYPECLQQLRDQDAQVLRHGLMRDDYNRKYLGAIYVERGQQKVSFFRVCPRLDEMNEDSAERLTLVPNLATTFSKCPT